MAKLLHSPVRSSAMFLGHTDKLSLSQCLRVGRNFHAAKRAKGKARFLALPPSITEPPHRVKCACVQAPPKLDSEAKRVVEGLVRSKRLPWVCMNQCQAITLMSHKDSVPFQAGFERCASLPTTPKVCVKSYKSKESWCLWVSFRFLLAFRCSSCCGSLTPWSLQCSHQSIQTW